MRSTFKIAFHVNKSKQRDGVVPVMGRITINGTIAQFSCKLTIDPNLWDAKSNRATGRSERALHVNRELDNIRMQLLKHYQRITEKVGYVNAEMVRNAWQGLGTEYETLLAALDGHNAEFAKRTGVDRSQNTYDKYVVVRLHLSNFIKYKYNRADVHLKEITEGFIRDFDTYMQTRLGLSSSTAWLYCIPLKMIVTRAHNNGIISSNPFAHYRIRPDIKERGYLTEEELRRMIDCRLDDRKLEVVRDLFVFAAFTGLSYIDVKNLTADKIITFPDGSQWVTTLRAKTKMPVNVKLLEVPLRLVEKYRPARGVDRPIFPVPCSGDCNARLREVAARCGIERHITFHLSRHSFATLALTKGVPIESVSRILGHTNITTTQIYAKITTEKIGRDMDMMSSRLDGLSGV